MWCVIDLDMDVPSEGVSKKELFQKAVESLNEMLAASSLGLISEETLPITVMDAIEEENDGESKIEYFEWSSEE